MPTRVPVTTHDMSPWPQRYPVLQPSRCGPQYIVTVRLQLKFDGHGNCSNPVDNDYFKLNNKSIHNILHSVGFVDNTNLRTYRNLGGDIVVWCHNIKVAS